jgi:hypothetical protein
MSTLDALFKANDQPQLLVATITTNRTTAGVSHDLSNCIDQVVAVVLTTFGTWTGSLKLLLEESDDNSTFTTISNSNLRLKNANGTYLEPDDKADAAKLIANGVSKLAFLKSKKYFKASVVSENITGSAVVSVIVQYEKAFQI